MRLFDIGGPPELRPASDRVLTLPNALSVARIALLPVLYGDLTSDRPARALLLMVLITASDWFDGYLARVLDQRTRLGAVLDPIGDRLVFIVVGAGLVVGGLLPVWLLVVLLARELVVVLVGAFLLARRGMRIPDTSRLGKVATSGLMLSMVALIAASALGEDPSRPVRWLQVAAWGGLTINLSLTYLATVGYARAALGARG